MATLTLKKRGSHLVQKTPLPNLVGKYAVTRQLPDFKSMRFTVCHDTFEKAQSEAARFQATETKYRYLIVQVLETVGE